MIHLEASNKMREMVVTVIKEKVADPNRNTKRTNDWEPNKKIGCGKKTEWNRLRAYSVQFLEQE